MGKFEPCPFWGNEDIKVLPQKEGMKMIKCWICTANKLVCTDSKKQLYAEWNNRAKWIKMK